MSLRVSWGRRFWPRYLIFYSLECVVVCAKWRTSITALRANTPITIQYHQQPVCFLYDGVHLEIRISYSYESETNYTIMFEVNLRNGSNQFLYINSVCIYSIAIHDYACVHVDREHDLKVLICSSEGTHTKMLYDVLFVEQVCLWPIVFSCSSYGGLQVFFVDVQLRCCSHGLCSEAQ